MGANFVRQGQGRENGRKDDQVSKLSLLGGLWACKLSLLQGLWTYGDLDLALKL